MRYIIFAVFSLMFFGAGHASAAEPAPARHITVITPEGPAAQPGGPDTPVRHDAIVDPSTRDTLTVNGIVSAMDPDSHTISMNTPSGEIKFFYDDETRFQSGLKRIDLALVSPGSRIAVLYTIRDGRAYLKRLMFVPDRSYGPTKPGSYHKGRHKSRKSHSSKHHTKKSVKKKSKKKTHR